MNNYNYATEVVKNLKAQGYTENMIIGYLEGMVNGLKYMENKKVDQYLARTVKDTQPK